MLKAIIADDEQRIITLIKNLIDWDEVGIEVVAEANNGMDALLLVKEMMPDILITDIRFPGIDGLELTKRVYELDPSIRTIIISGHKQFDYAHTALQYGVVEYLVKPINKEALERVLNKISRDLSLERINSQEVADLIEDQNSKTQRLRKQFILDCMSQQMHLSTTTDINSEYCYDFVDGTYIAWLVHVDVGDEKEVNSHVLAKIQTMIVDKLQEECLESQTIAYQANVITVGNFGHDKGDHISYSLDKTFDAICRELEFYGKVTLTSSLSETSKILAFMPEMFMQMKRAMHARCILGSKQIIYSSQVSASRGENFLSETDKISLAGMIENCEQEALKNWINHKYAQESKHLEMKPWLVYQGAVEIEALYDAITLGSTQVANNIFDVNSRLFMADGKDRLIRRLTKDLLTDLSKRYDERKLRESQPIRLAKTYMQDHLSQPITIEDISVAVGLSYTYFSGLFKNETGMTVSQHLLELRIDVAKKMMRETTKNLSEVASSVGYSDSKHFSKVFRKATGITFKEYKRLYS